MNQNEDLECLRDITKLTALDKIKILRAKRKAEKTYNSINDESLVQDLEIHLRKNALQRKIEDEWRDYIYAEHDDCGLGDFANIALEQYKVKKYQLKKQ